MHKDYKNWLKNKGLTNQYATDIENKIENAYGDLENYFINGTYEEEIIGTLEYSKEDEINNEGSVMKIV